VNDSQVSEVIDYKYQIVPVPGTSETL